MNRRNAMELPLIRLIGLSLTSVGTPTKTRVPPVFNSDMYGSNGWSPDAVSIMKSSDFAIAYMKERITVNLLKTKHYKPG